MRIITGALLVVVCACSAANSDDVGFEVNLVSEEATRALNDGADWRELCSECVAVEVDLLASLPKLDFAVRPDAALRVSTQDLEWIRIGQMEAPTPGEPNFWLAEGVVVEGKRAEFERVGRKFGDQRGVVYRGGRPVAIDNALSWIGSVVVLGVFKDQSEAIAFSEGLQLPVEVVDQRP